MFGDFSRATEKVVFSEPQWALLLRLFPPTKPGEGLPMLTILETAVNDSDFDLLWTGLKKYKQIHVDKLMKNAGKGRKSIPTPEAAAAKCLRASLKFKYSSIEKKKKSNP